MVVPPGTKIGEGGKGCLGWVMRDEEFTPPGGRNPQKALLRLVHQHILGFGAGRGRPLKALLILVQQHILFRVESLVLERGSSGWGASNLMSVLPPSLREGWAHQPLDTTAAL